MWGFVLGDSLVKLNLKKIEKKKKRNSCCHRPVFDAAHKHLPAFIFIQSGKKTKKTIGRALIIPSVGSV